MFFGCLMVSLACLAPATVVRHFVVAECSVLVFCNSILFLLHSILPLCLLQLIRSLRQQDLIFFPGMQIH